MIIIIQIVFFSYFLDPNVMLPRNPHNIPTQYVPNQMHSIKLFKIF